jgi:hypothetical protein
MGPHESFPVKYTSGSTAAGTSGELRILIKTKSGLAKGATSGFGTN